MTPFTPFSAQCDKSPSLKTFFSVIPRHPVACLTKVLIAGPKHFEHDGHHYWFSGKEENFTDHKVDWLDGRNICREYCMDLVSLETPSENDLISKFLTDSKL